MPNTNNLLNQLVEKGILDPPKVIEKSYGFLIWEDRNYKGKGFSIQCSYHAKNNEFDEIRVSFGEEDSYLSQEELKEFCYGLLKNPKYLVFGIDWQYNDEFYSRYMKSPRIVENTEDCMREIATENIYSIQATDSISKNGDPDRASLAEARIQVDKLTDEEVSKFVELLNKTETNKVKILELK